jgi:hypothetical protein
MYLLCASTIIFKKNDTFTLVKRGNMIKFNDMILILKDGVFLWQIPVILCEKNKTTEVSS